jgi:hypothetical protein
MAFALPRFVSPTHSSITVSMSVDKNFPERLGKRSQAAAFVGDMDFVYHPPTAPQFVNVPPDKHVDLSDSIFEGATIAITKANQFDIRVKSGSFKWSDRCYSSQGDKHGFRLRDPKMNEVVIIPTKQRPHLYEVYYMKASLFSSREKALASKGQMTGKEVKLIGVSFGGAQSAIACQNLEIKTPVNLLVSGQSARMLGVHSKLDRSTRLVGYRYFKNKLNGIETALPVLRKAIIL